MTVKLCGFSASNYYNKLKLQLLEKGVAFEEELVWTGNTHPKLVDRSPMGKVPFWKHRTVVCLNPWLAQNILSNSTHRTLCCRLTRLRQPK